MDSRSIRHDVQRQVSHSPAALAARTRLPSQPPPLTAPISLRRLDSWFFSKGQVIETHRGKGIYQKAIDEATYKLEQGQWVSRGVPSRRSAHSREWRPWRRHSSARRGC